MSEICIIGEKEFISGFESLGFSVFPVKNNVETEEALKKVIEQKFSIIYLMEDFLENFEKTREISKTFTGTIITIPGQKKGKNIGWMRLKKMVEEATGVDLLKG